MRFFRDDLGTLVPVEWYYVPDDRAVVPYAHPFGSRDWELAEEQPLLGEVYGTRTYYAGDHAPELAGIGLCGSREQWERGASILDPVRPLNVTTGRQCCCGRGAIVLEPGSVIGMSLEQVPFPTVGACAVFDPSPQYWRLDAAGIIDGACAGCGVFNGSHLLTHFAACRWNTPSMNFCGGLIRRWILDIEPVPGLVWLRLLGNGVPAQTVLYATTVAAWNPMGPNVLALDPGSVSGQCGGFPPTLTVVPDPGP